jgi:hypothetical protein
VGSAGGHSIGIGPMLTWSAKLYNTHISATFRWVNEFAASKRPKGNRVQLSVSASFE